MIRIGFGTGWKTRTLAVVVVLLFLGGIPASSSAMSESWDAMYIGGNKIGYVWTRVEPVKDGDKQLVRVRVDVYVSFKRGKDKVTMELEYGTIETPEGQILRLDTRTHASNQMIRVHGDVINGKMRLKNENGDQKQEKVIDWPIDTLGPYGVEMSLSRKQMKPGEVRQIKTYTPDLNKIGDVTLTAVGMENVPLGGGTTRELLRVDQETSFDGKKAPELAVTFWVDAGGQVLKSFTDNNGGMISYRTTREAAMKGIGNFDLMAASIVKTRKIANPESTRGITYRLTMPDVNPTEIFPNDRRQTIKDGASKTSATLEVTTAPRFAGEAGPEEVGPEYLGSNTYITCTDSKVIQHAREAVGRETDPWAKAQAINAWVFKRMKHKNFETSFAPADEVARNLSGDCTEHAVLSAAMCRSQGIPARVATGLVYAESLGGFGFHMWNEVYVNRRWVAIDSAFDETDVDAVHLKLSESSLEGVSPFESFMAVARVFGKLKIEVVEIH